MKPILNPDGTWFGVDFSEDIDPVHREIVESHLIGFSNPTRGEQGWQVNLTNLPSSMPYLATYKTIGGDWRPYDFSVDQLMARQSMFVKEIVVEQEDGPTLVATGLLANTMSRGRLFGKGHVISWAENKEEQEKILYYSGKDSSHNRPHVNVGTVGHCDWGYKQPFEHLSPLRRIIRAINNGL